jgi:hypothetical protein
MSQGLSIEIIIPPSVDESAVISIGERYAPDGWEGVMTVSEAMEWAFMHPSALMLLKTLGIRWETIATGR